MNKKFKGLGRGLDALMGDTSATESLQNLPIGALQPGKYQPRTQMDPEALEDLAASIRGQGLMQPVLVRPIGDDRHHPTTPDLHAPMAASSPHATTDTPLDKDTPLRDDIQPNPRWIQSLSIE